MKTILLDIDNIEPFAAEVDICLGYFDGVHLGHRKVITRAVADSDRQVAVLTFDAPLGNIIGGRKAREVLTSVDDRFRLIHRLGADYLLVLHTDEKLLAMSAESFIDTILKPLNIGTVYAGEDFRFGRKKAGDIALLRKFFPVISIDLMDCDGQKVSTSEIIRLLKSGDISRANVLLGRHYQMKGTITEGLHNGKTIGFPTANLRPDAPYVVPKYGVYKTICYIDGLPHLSLANIGLHPTIQELQAPSIEVHIPDYVGEDYGKVMYLEFIAFLREEKRFSSTLELREQIARDIASLQHLTK